MKKILIMVLTGVICLSLSPFNITAAENGNSPALTEKDFLKANGRDLRNQYGEGEIVNLRGTNVGGWLLQEFWMTPTSYGANANAETDIFRILTERFGKDVMIELVDLYQANYFTEEDLDNCAAMGMNCLRLPFWYRNLVDENGDFYEDGFRYIDWFIEEAGKRGMYVILDMHGAPGSQNGSDHSGKDGGNNKEAASELFFGPNAEANQELFYQIWEVIAERYKGNPAVAGYDLMNEPFCTYRYSSRLGASGLHNILWPIYDEAYRRIRAIDPDHVIIMAATWDPIDLPDPSVYGWENVMYQYHNYAQGTVSDLNNTAAVIANMRSKLNLIVNAAYDVPSYMGEFNFYGGLNTWDQGLAMFNELGISWTTWTYKTTPQNGSWGLYHHHTNQRINVETSTLEQIRERWQESGLSRPNSSLISIVSRHLTAPVTANSMAPQPADFAEGDYYLTGVNSNRIITVQSETLALSSSENRYTSADGQIFTLVRNGDGTFSLLSKLNGKYVSVNQLTMRLHADAESIGDTEKFHISQMGWQLTLRSVSTGQYVCADENIAGTPLVANRSNASGWEQFLLTPSDGAPAEPPPKEDGTPTPDPSPDPGSAPGGGGSGQPEEPKGPGGLVYGLVGGIIVLAAACVLLVLRKKSKKAK
jgi:aryl-phospho-beta-D-glucosidase BglC (GH1 family)